MYAVPEAERADPVRIDGFEPGVHPARVVEESNPVPEEDRGGQTHRYYVRRSMLAVWPTDACSYS